MDNEILHFDRKWFLLENKRNIKRVVKLFSFNKTKHPLLIYTFIDSEEGISALILGNIKVKDNVAYIEKNMYEENIYLIRYDELMTFDLTDVKEDLIKKIENTKEVEEIIYAEFYKGHEKLLLLREDRKLDKFRVNNFVDKVEVLFMNKDKTSEKIICELSEKVSDKDYIVKVLSDPKLNFNVSKDELVPIKYVDLPKFEKLVFLNREEKEEQN